MKNYKSKATVRILLNLLSDPAAIVDEKANFMTVNEAFQEVTGLNEKELVGASMLKLNIVSPETKAILLENLKNRMQGSPVESYEVCFTAKTGEIRWVEVIGKKISYTGQPASLVLFHDVTDRKNKAEQTIKETEKRYHELVEALPEIVFEADLTGKLTFFNQTAFKTTGYTQEEFKKGLNMLQFVVPEQRERAVENIKKTLTEGSGEPHEYTLIRRDGNTYPALVKTSPIVSGNKVTGLRGFLLDITERNKSEQILKASEEKFRNLAENSPNMIFIYQKGKVVYANKEAEGAMGYTKEEYYSPEFNFLNLIVPENRELVISNFAKHTKGEDTAPYEYGLMTKNGDRIDAILNTKIITYKGEPAILGIATDITDRKLMQYALEESEEKFRTITNSVKDAIILVDDEARVVYWNPAAEKTFGYSTVEAIGKEVHELISSKTMSDAGRKSIKVGVKQFASTGIGGAMNRNVELLGRRKDGTQFPVKLSIAPIKLRGKWHAVGVAKDITERKQAEQKLKEAELILRHERNMLEAVTENVGAGILLISKDYKILKANTFNKKIFGKDLEQKTCYKRLHGLNKTCPNCGVKRVFNGAETDIRETSAKDQAGNKGWFNVVATPIKDEKGNVTAALELAVTTTERRQIEIKLHEAEKRYRALFNEAPLGVLVIDPQTAKPLEFNDLAHTQLGYSREEFSKLRISDFEAREKTDETEFHIAKMVQEGGDEFETKHRTKNGEIRNVLVNTRVVELSGKPFLYCVFHDITEIRRVQDALMESETKYRQLVNVAQEGIWAFDNNYRTVFVNPRMAQMLGCSEGELVGKSIFEFLDKKHVEKAKQFLGEFAQGFKGHFDYTFTRKDGSRTYVSITASVINDDEGKPVGSLAMVSDITDRKALERKVNNYSNHLKSMVELRTVQLKYANEKVVRSERLAAIGELAGMVGHDLRNPLAGIKNAAYFLKKKGSSISEVQSKEMLEIIEKAIEHSDKIINDLLDYAREMHLELIESTVPTLLDTSLRMIPIPDRIQILNHVLDEIRINVDADKIIRIFVNLIKNAIDAMPEKGTLEITSSHTKDCVKIAFADTGTGIPEETLKKIFTPLFTTKAQGMGFGLAICKRIIEAHGGTINVETRVNHGTTFIVTLPIKPKIQTGGGKTWISMPESLLLTTTKA